MKLATMMTPGGPMEISLEDRDGKRLLLGRTPEWQEGDEITGASLTGYKPGDEGIVDAIADLRYWYGEPACRLELLVKIDCAREGETGGR